MVQHVMGPRLKSLTRDQLCSASCHQRDKTHPQPPQSAARGRLPTTYTGALAVCGQGAYMLKLEKRGGGAQMGEYAYTTCTPARINLALS
jgi:hypothetical protein